MTLPGRTTTAPGLVLSLAALFLLPSPALAQTGSRIEPLPPEALAALRALAARGAAALVLDPDGGPRSRVTVAVPVRADLNATRRALVEAEGWPGFMPALGAVEPLSRHGRRAAWRMTVRAGLLDVHAVTQVHEVSPRRVDFSITESDFGSAAARWELHPQPDGTTLLALTSWSDPSEGHWLLRRAAGSNPTATAGINVAIGLVLARAVQRQAEHHGGLVRPAPAAADTATTPPLPTPEPGPWDALSTRWYVLSFGFRGDGTATEVTATARTRASAAHIQERLDAVAGWPQFLPALRLAEPADADRARVTLRSPFDDATGLLAHASPSPGVTVWQGQGPGLAASSWRWDLRPTPEGDTLVTLSGRVDPDLSATLPRAAAAREPLLYVGLTGLRQLLWMRGLLAGLGPG